MSVRVVWAGSDFFQQLAFIETMHIINIITILYLCHFYTQGEALRNPFTLEDPKWDFSLYSMDHTKSGQ
jgi:hypothetical protein